MRIRIAVVFPLLLAGCSVSRTHIGFHNFGKGNVWHSVVGKKYVETLRDKEDIWMVRLARLDFDALSEDFAPTLASYMKPKVVQKLALQIKRDYGPNGFALRRRFGTPAFSTGKAVRTDAFEFYDMVGFAYTMEGKVPSDVLFYVTRMDGETKICGFEIKPLDEAEREKAKDVRIILPETTNRSDVALKPSMLFRPAGESHTW